MTGVKAQVVLVAARGVSVSPLTGHMKGEIFGLPFRGDVKKGQFVDILLHPSGQRAEWSPTG
jgi:hypothetical protein